MNITEFGATGGNIHRQVGSQYSLAAIEANLTLKLLACRFFVASYLQIPQANRVHDQFLNAQVSASRPLHFAIFRFQRKLPVTLTTPLSTGSPSPGTSESKRSLLRWTLAL